jgi:hypothetical protein
MIRYALICENDHQFESWFQSGDAYDTLKTSGMISCPSCNSTSVEKSLMAPKVRSARKGKVQPPVPAPSQMTNTPDPEVVEAVAKLKAHVEKNSDYVGDKFAKEARAMHEGEKPHRAIHGEAKPEEAKKLIEDGVPALPLPFIPKQKTN